MSRNELQSLPFTLFPRHSHGQLATTGILRVTDRLLLAELRQRREKGMLILKGDEAFNFNMAFLFQFSLSTGYVGLVFLGLSLSYAISSPLFGLLSDKMPVCTPTELFLSCFACLDL